MLLTCGGRVKYIGSSCILMRILFTSVKIALIWQVHLNNATLGIGIGNKRAIKLGRIERPISRANTNFRNHLN